MGHSTTTTREKKKKLEANEKETKGKEEETKEGIRDYLLSERKRRETTE